jgi:hypothetical protein
MTYDIWRASSGTVVAVYISRLAYNSGGGMEVECATGKDVEVNTDCLRKDTETRAPSLILPAQSLSFLAFISFRDEF